MIKIDYILIIFNCEKYRHKALHQKNSWLLEIDIPYYHVIGNINLDSDYYFDDTERILYVKTLDDYNSLPKKVISAYNAVNCEYEFNYIFKTDDDQILTNNKFFNVIKNVLNKHKPDKNNPDKTHYGGYIINVTQPYLSKYNKIHPELPSYLPILTTKYCSGRFYLLSMEAIQNLLTNKHKIEKEYLEDYAIGYHLDNKFKINMLPIQTDKYFKDIVLKN